MSRYDGTVMRLDVDLSTHSPFAPSVPWFLLEEPPVEKARREQAPAKVLPIWRKIYVYAMDIGARHVSLEKRPLLVEVTPGVDCPINVFAPSLGMGGVGRDIQSAVDDLEDTIGAVYMRFSAMTEARLAPSASATLAKLRALLG